MCGVVTNIVTTAEIHERDASDTIFLPSLLAKTAQYFRVREVSADKGYSSAKNHEAIVAAGATPYIPFKSNATGRLKNNTSSRRAGIWEKAFYFFSLHREEFLARYHRRSNVETTMSMIKAKFRDDVRSRNETAMMNEVYCKVLCHNICCLIQAIYELGIEPEFQALAA
jgi:transposase